MVFERFADQLDYPMFVVTAAHAGTGEQAGCLVGFASQCSIVPARFLACLSTANHTYRIALAAPVLAVHTLRAGQHELAALFGEQTGDDVDKFARCRWESGVAGVPLLADCPDRFTGTVLTRLDGLGDHVGFVLDPLDPEDGADAAPGRRTADPVPAPLMFSTVRDLRPGHPA
ncbi:flavin reductase family protein [Streptomycetaceae bacterium NBC_01309]